jgi:hypothetical protein
VWRCCIRSWWQILCWSRRGNRRRSGTETTQSGTGAAVSSICGAEDNKKSPAACVSSGAEGRPPVVVSTGGNKKSSATGVSTGAEDKPPTLVSTGGEAPGAGGWSTANQDTSGGRAPAPVFGQQQLVDAQGPGHLSPVGAKRLCAAWMQRRELPDPLKSSAQKRQVAQVPKLQQ